MAIKEDEVKNKWAEKLKIEQEKKKAAKEAVDAHKAAGLLKIKNDKVAGSPTSSPYSKDWRYEGDDIEQQWKDTGGWGFGTESDGQGFFTPLPLAHHTGGGPGLDGFQDVPPQEILRRHITGEQPLSPEDLERIFGPDYEKLLQQQQQKQSLKIGRA